VGILGEEWLDNGSSLIFKAFFKSKLNDLNQIKDQINKKKNVVKMAHKVKARLLLELTDYQLADIGNFNL
jgi:hypothetical protein